LVVAITVLACASAFGQGDAPDPGSGSATADEDTSRRVDESEESYRARMELRDQRYQEQKRSNMIYSSHGETSKLDQLPEASQEHIKQQLREMIMASRQWKPGEDVSDYPYEPSSAAQTDAKLRNQEREAWAEQLDKYQQREAAAYADAQRGRDGAADDGESGNGKADRNAAGSSSASSQRAAGKNRDSDSFSESPEAAEEISDAGVFENALSFVRGSDPQSTGLPAEPTRNAGGRGSSGSSSQDAPLPEEESVDSPADTLAIRDLENLNSTPLQDSPIDLSSDVTGVGQNPAVIQPEEPGTLEIKDLEHLEVN